MEIYTCVPRNTVVFKQLFFKVFQVDSKAARILTF